jgi:hypothetical protein
VGDVSGCCGVESWALRAIDYSLEIIPLGRHVTIGKHSTGEGMVEYHISRPIQWLQRAPVNGSRCAKMERWRHTWPSSGSFGSGRLERIWIRDGAEGGRVAVGRGEQTAVERLLGEEDASRVRLARHQIDRDRGT